MVTCEYCGAIFTQLYNLRKHQRSAKYCLQLRGGDSSEEYTCEYCKKGYGRKDALYKHQRICLHLQIQIENSKDVNEKVIETVDKKVAQVQNVQLLELITQLQQTIAGMQQGGNTINRNNVVLQNMAPITDEDIQDHLEHLTLNFIQEGAKGYADFANSYPFKNRVLCTDKARKKLKYKDADGEVVEDGGGVKLAQKFFQAIAPRNEEIINIEYRALHEKVQQIAKDGTAYRADLTGLLTKASHLQELLIKCQEAARGEENDLTKEFVSHLSKML
uniref:C2H2-type domain-containing protein n=1 Tax=Marseillevirus LCMAC202 TaxID=2506606 RepID=A0A481YZP7_9VIRU|nr:MAG: hypothetical protein LCMAC202_02970 [Marseillevirus LCMAC202]